MMRPLTLFHAPRTRSLGIRVLLEELGLPYTVRTLNLKGGEQRQPGFLAVNPLGKVPALLDGDTLVTEQVALTLLLADRVPEARLAPPFDDTLRGTYLRWVAFYGSAFEPAMVDHALGREPQRGPMSVYSSFGAVLDAVDAQLTPGPWLLGKHFTAADVLWGWGLTWTTRRKAVPERASFAAYTERFRARPAFQRAMAADQALLAEMAADGA